MVQRAAEGLHEFGDEAGMDSPEASWSSSGFTRAFPPSMRSRQRSPWGVEEAEMLCTST